MSYIVGGLALMTACIFILFHEASAAGGALGVMCFFSGLLVCIGAQVRHDQKYARRMKGRI